MRIALDTLAERISLVTNDGEYEHAMTLEEAIDFSDGLLANIEVLRTIQQGKDDEELRSLTGR